MLKGSRRGNYVSTLNKPFVIHKIGKPQHVSKDEILRFLDDFITSKEAFVDNNNNNTGNSATNINNDNDANKNTLQQNQIATAGGASDITLNIDTNLTSSLSQLKRIQRDFKGLPPQSVALSSITRVDNTDDKRTESKDTEQEKEDKISKSATGGTKKTFAD